MLKLVFRKQFERELKRLKKRGKDLAKIKRVIAKLANEEELEARYRNHRLRGDFKNRWECHIEPDWLLVYKRTASELILERTGTHSDLFKK